MTTETVSGDAPTLTEAPAKAVAAVVEAPKGVADEGEAVSAKLVEAVAKPARKATAKSAAKSARKPARKSAPRKIKTTTKTVIKAARKTSAKAAERTETMTKKTNSAFNFAKFDTVPGFAPFQNLIADASERGQDFAKKSQKVAEEFADLAKANVEAMVEAGKIAVEGTKSLGQDVIATGRDGVEQASDAIRSLAEAKSPTEFVQLQGEFARASFDRMVAETSKLTEAMVKLAGEAFQPIQARASKNAERFNNFVA